VASVDLGSKAGVGAAAGGTAMLSAATQRVVYFDFDSFAIKDDYKGLIEGHAKMLSANRGKRMVVEGHTDERGGREYNLALGQKRAAAVVKSLSLLGAGDNQLEAVSFGEERPVAQGGDESAWAKNRRAELKDR
jgi:peptidoglycan-associated lipoprotein